LKEVKQANELKVNVKKSFSGTESIEIYSLLTAVELHQDAEDLSNVKNLNQLEVSKSDLIKFVSEGAQDFSSRMDNTRLNGGEKIQ
jgi:hypothetical protein